ncbi:MAG: hypothetical protein ACXVAT_19640 [Isosphaeraceae bacterium]
MMNRRGFVLSLTTGLVALVLVVGSVLAEELVGTIIKVDADAKLIVVVPKDSDKEIKIKVTDKTELVTRKGTRKVDLEKLEKNLQKAKDNGDEGIHAKITYIAAASKKEDGVASKIQYTAKKKASQ